MPKIIREINGVPVFRENRLPFESMSLLSESIDILRKLKGQRIVSVVKLIANDPVRYLNDFPSIREDQLFSQAFGPVFFIMENGFCAGFCDSILNVSLLVWQENFPLTIEETSKKCIYFDKGCFIDCKDERLSNSYCASFVGCRIENLSILMAHEPGARLAKNERGLLVGTNDGREFPMSMRLQENVHTGFVLMSRENIRENIKKYITSISI